MDISRSIKDIIFITPAVICGLLFASVTTVTYLTLLLWSNLIFIYERVSENINVK
jgi:hypothetical protein